MYIYINICLYIYIYIYILSVIYHFIYIIKIHELNTLIRDLLIILSHKRRINIL